MPPSNGHALPQERSVELKGVRVLVVEDAWHVASTLKALLEELGMVVAGPAATVAEAERLATAHPPDVAVVDVKLKDETAYNLITRLHETAVPVIVMSGYAILPKLTEKTAAVLQKPFNGPDLVAALRRALSSDVGR